MALCHEWLGRWTGSEKTFITMAEAFPSADLFALTLDRSQEFIKDGRPVRTTFVDRIPLLRSSRAAQLPVMPLAWRYASGCHYDVVLSSSHACAKGFRPGRSAVHLSYCHTPMRYAWLPAVDRRSKGGRLHTAGQAYFRHWDRQSTRWVDEFAANSSCVQKRIQDYYGRSSQVIFPPVDVGYFCPAPPGEPKGDYALAVGRMIGYKRFDLAIEACALAGCRLIVAGHGPEEHRLRALAEKLRSDVEFVIEPGDAVLRNLYRKARLLLFAGEEDFGIVPVEAQACGTPVLAYGTGGVVDTVVHGVTGVLVPEQDACSFATALTSLLDRPLDAVSCRLNAERFRPERFRQELRRWVLGATRTRGIDLDLH